MTTTRHNVFETNSSSTHSISINADTQLFDSITPEDDGTIILGHGEYGWEFETYYNALSKADYCALDMGGDPVKKEMLIRVIKNHTGAKDVIFDLTGYIDHQSAGTSDDAFESDETLKAFIFGKGSYLETGNDNDY